MDRPKASRSTHLLVGPICIGVLLVCVTILTILWQRAREEARTSTCVSNLYGVGSALEYYHAVHCTYPPLSGGPSTADPAVSWRVAIVLSMNPDVNGYNLGEAWNSPRNEQFIPTLYGKIFSCPSDSAGRITGRTSYLAVVGKGTVWSEVRLGHIRNPDKEVPQKIIVIEVPHSGIYWIEPRDISVDEAIRLFRLENGLKNGPHRSGLHYLTADGTVHSFNDIASVEEFASLLRSAD